MFSVCFLFCDNQKKDNMKKNTFILEINDIQNNSWQGNVKWVQGKKIESFRSALELLYLLGSVVEEEDLPSFVEDLLEREK